MLKWVMFVTLVAMRMKENFTSISRGTVLQSPGEVGGCFYEVKSGLLRSFIINAEGKESTYLFGPAGWVVGDAVSAQEPRILYIEAIEDSVVKVIQKANFAEMPQTVDTIRLQRLHRRILVMQQRILMLMSASALERYEHFVQTYPDILQRVPQRMVASYLGITPEALSKIKKRSLQGIS